MRIYAVADIHAKPSRIERVRAGVKEHAPNVLVVAGDICSYVRPRYVYSHLNDMGIPVLTVRGNSDRLWHERCLHRYENVTSLHMREVIIRGFAFSGISGSVPVPFRTRIAFREKALLEKAASSISAETILVVHPPPYGTLDRVLGRISAGSKGVAGLVAACMPRLVLCGHIHEDTGIENIGGTLVVNCSMSESVNGAVIDFDRAGGENRPVAKMV